MTEEPSTGRELKPIYCLADSQLLFWREPDAEAPWLETVARDLPEHGARAAYIGASNGDDPDFYSIFAAAMESIGVTDHRMILSTFPEEDRRFLDTADLILLAGGDPLRGWRVFEQSGMREAITRRYFEGATLVGISAGAVQLGWAIAPDDRAPEELDSDAVHLTFRLVPAILEAHGEASDWQLLRRLLQISELSVRGLGLPSGGGLAYHPDGTVEPIRRPLQEIVLEDGALRQSLLFPEEGAPDTPRPRSPRSTEPTDPTTKTFTRPGEDDTDARPLSRRRERPRRTENHRTERRSTRWPKWEGTARRTSRPTSRSTRTGIPT